MITKKKKTPQKTAPAPLDSDLDSGAAADEKCCIFNRFYPKDMDALNHIKIVSWGKCDECGSWVHLQFCTNIKVIRRGAKFFCPGCDKDKN
jgi:hypothetical protein